MNGYVKFNKTGELLITERQDCLNYHLYLQSVPCSISINEELNYYLFENTELHTHLIINNINLQYDKIGKLTKAHINGVDKYFLNDDDIEELLFYNTGLETNIQMKAVGSNDNNDKR